MGPSLKAYLRVSLKQTICTHMSHIQLQQTPHVQVQQSQRRTGALQAAGAFNHNMQAGVPFKDSCPSH